MDLNNTHHHQQYPSQQQNSGLLRYRSAPSSLLADSCGGFDSKRLISRFMTHPNGHNNTTSSDSPSFPDFDDKSGLSFRNPDSDYSLSSSQLNCQQLPPQYPRQSNTSNPMETSYGLVASVAMDLNSQVGTISSNLMRQNSSPAGLFTQISPQNGYASIKGMGSYGGLNGTSGELSPSASTLKRQMSFSSGMSSSLGVLSQISEVGNEDVEVNNSVDVKLGNGHIDARFCSPGFPYGSWNDSSLFADNITVAKREQDSDAKSFPVNQSGELGNRVQLLSHHLSLPKTSSELGAIEKILHFQDTVPCKIRAKRGCATHPRSIAERMRRTRISERMRKLQELVPHMDKQTNTADMLDLAVEYIKDLQTQFKTLNETRAKCKCSNLQKSVSNQAS